MPCHNCCIYSKLSNHGADVLALSEPQSPRMDYYIVYLWMRGMNDKVKVLLLLVPVSPVQPAFPLAVEPTTRLLQAP